MIRNRTVTQLHSSFLLNAFPFMSTSRTLGRCYFKVDNTRAFFCYHLFLFLGSLWLSRCSQCFPKVASFSDKGGYPQTSMSGDQNLKLWNSIVISKYLYHHSAYSCLVNCVGNNLKVPLRVTEALHQPVHDSLLLVT